MKTLKSNSRRLSAVLLVLALVLSAAVSCSKDDDGYGGDDSGGDNGGGAGTNTVKIQGMAFSPSTITVTVGTTITWKNYDNVAHTVTSDDGLFDSGSISTNGTFTRTFDSAGTFDYHCTPHPTMTASVVVTN